MFSISKYIKLFAAISFILLVNSKILSQDFNCMDCHENVIQKSVHFQAIDCQGCHQDVIDESHVDNKDKIKKVECQNCHDGQLASMKNDIHRRLKSKVKNPPDCKKCHGTHDVKKPPVENALKVKEICSKCHTSGIGLKSNYHSISTAKNQCLACHKNVDVKLTLPSSVHKDLQCADCHNFVANNLANHPKNLKVTQKADCYICHGEIAKEHRESIHGISLDEGIDEAAKCWDCHGSHDIKHVKHESSKVHPKNLANTCGTCHDNKELMKKYDVAIPNPGHNFANSVHGKLVLNGRLDAATCSVCHGVHNIKNKVQDGSTISTFNIPTLCGKCHEKESGEYQKSIHWIRAKKGFRESPVCDDCHSEHSIEAVTTMQQRTEAKKIQEKTCLICHENPRIAERFGKSGTQAKQYHDSYHGLAVLRGDKDAAMCVDCHSVHKILPQDHPESSVNQNNVTATCRKCHADATETFSKSYSHKTEDKTASKIEDVVANIYFWLIVSVIGGMILHNFIIFVYEIRKKKRHLENEITIPRFTQNEVYQHYLLLISFLTLSITGFALKYSQSWWAEMLYTFGMSETVRQNIHRGAAVVMIVTGLYHLWYLIFTPRGRDVLVNLIPKYSDVVEARENIMYYLHLSEKKPQFDKYDYTEKAEYWALIWGTLIMGVTGFILWFPTIVGDWAPVWLIKVSELIHFYEAILATLAIIVWHWFFVIFHPNEYPMSVTWIDGKMSLHNYRHHHEKHFRRVVLEWQEYKTGLRSDKKVSNSTWLFTKTMEKNGLNPDTVIQHEIDNDQELRIWLEQKLQPKVPLDKNI